ncbi:MFS transporter [Galactobacter valiniphilus]|uniref:MFS transporter n=1 Tax=Galactobacter valiniphilus TaxID=2676122 RepID=UPI00373631A7
MNPSSAPSAARPEAAATPRKSSRRAATASLVGTTIEYYDFMLYGLTAALVFPRVFFPEQSPLVGALLSFATFGIGFLARPLGGIVFGHFGDRVGRKKMLIITLIGMGVCTFFMGLIPGHDAIGDAAPVILIVLRFVQGFMVGGEWGGATLMAVEHAPAGKKGLYGTFAQMGAPSGVTLASLVFMLSSMLPDTAYYAWGWRVPFLFSIVLVVVGLVIRAKVAESPEFAASLKNQEVVKVPFVEAWRTQWKQILLTAGVYLGQGVMAYVALTYLVSYASTTAHIDRTITLLGVAIASALCASLHPVFGSLSDRIGRKTVYMIGSVLLLASIVPAFMLVNTGTNLGFILAIVLVQGVSMPFVSAVTGPLITTLFPSNLRYTGSSVGYTIAQIVGPAFAPMIATAIFGATGQWTAVAWYLAAMCLISIVCVIALGGAWGIKEAKQQLAED